MMQQLRSCLAFLALAHCLSHSNGYTLHHRRGTTTKQKAAIEQPNRRTAITTGVSVAILGITNVFTPKEANAEPPTEFKNVGAQAPAPEGERPFETLPNGVKIKDFRVGSGDAVVGKGSKVSVQCTGRLLNLNGVVFYNTKKNDPDGFGEGRPLNFEVGSGAALPGLESGLMGMQKGGIRRIIVPPELGYTKFPGLEPIPINDVDQRALDSVIKNPRRDATLLFDVKLERVK